jgi:hypothetical protein
MNQPQNWNGVSAPTSYQGIRFRSRLEARWAIFFDELGIEWEFEKEAFDTKYGYYLPDFFLPSLNKWFIVKGQCLESDERRKVEDVCELTHSSALIACGGLPSQFELDKRGLSCYRFDFIGFIRSSGDGLFSDETYLPCICEQCGKFDFQYEGRYERNCQCTDNDKGHQSETWKHLTIQNALRKARGSYWDQQSKQFLPGE